MKRYLFLELFIIIYVFTITGCVWKTSTKKRVYESINTDISKCNIEVDNDTHGGFLGDGDYFVKAQCPDNFNAEIKKVGTWKELPLT